MVSLAIFGCSGSGKSVFAAVLDRALLGPREDGVERKSRRRGGRTYRFESVEPRIAGTLLRVRQTLNNLSAVSGTPVGVGFERPYLSVQRVVFRRWGAAGRTLGGGRQECVADVSLWDLNGESCDAFLYNYSNVPGFNWLQLKGINDSSAHDFCNELRSGRSTAGEFRSYVDMVDSASANPVAPWPLMPPTLLGRLPPNSVARDLACMDEALRTSNAIVLCVDYDTYRDEQAKMPAGVAQGVLGPMIARAQALRGQRHLAAPIAVCLTRSERYGPVPENGGARAIAFDRAKELGLVYRGHDAEVDYFLVSAFGAGNVSQTDPNAPKWKVTPQGFSDVFTWILDSYDQFV